MSCSLIFVRVAACPGGWNRAVLPRLRIPATSQRPLPSGSPGGCADVHFSVGPASVRSALSCAEEVRSVLDSDLSTAADRRASKAGL